MKGTGLREELGFDARFSDGLRWGLGDGGWQLHLGGRYLGRERVVFDEPGDSGYVTRQALVRFDGESDEGYGFRITGDFTPVSGQPAARLHEGYVEWTPDPAFGVIVGLVKMPTGLDRFMSLLFTEGVERPITATFQSGEEPGGRVFGTGPEGLFTYDAALSAGKSEVIYSSTLQDSQLGLDQGTGPPKMKAYLSGACAPFAGSDQEILRGMELHVFGETNFTSGVDLFNAFQIKSQDFGILWLSPASSSNELFFDGRRIIAGADPSWTAGPFMARGEFLFRRDRVARPSTGLEKNLDTLAWSGVVSWNLTGETSSIGKRVPPDAPLGSSEQAPGAVEVHLRAAGARLDRGVLGALGTDLQVNTNRFTSAEAGFNWWPVSNVRLSFEAVFEGYHQPIPIESGVGVKRGLTGVLARFQVDF